MKSGPVARGPGASIVVLAFLLALCAMVTAGRHALGQVAVTTARVLPELKAEDAARQLIALVNFATLPGISGSQFFIDEPQGIAPDNISLIKIPLGWEVDLDSSGVALIIETGLGLLDSSDEFSAIAPAGNNLAINVDRQVITGLVGLGVSVPVTEDIKVQPIISGGISYFQNDATVFGDFSSTGLDPVTQLVLLDWDVTAITAAASLLIAYDRPLQENLLELAGRYTFAYTSSVDAPIELLDFSGNTNTLNFFGRYGGPTGYAVYGNQIGWNVYATNTTFVGRDADALGFQYFFELGAGLDVELKDKDLPIDGVRLRAAGIVGENVFGYTIGMRLRF